MQPGHEEEGRCQEQEAEIGSKVSKIQKKEKLYAKKINSSSNPILLTDSVRNPHKEIMQAMLVTSSLRAERFLKC